jgi:thiol-disulfide isomerase/thioredoxin/predicted Zn-dependent protease
MISTRRVCSLVVSIVLAVPATPLCSQNAGEALADRLRAFNNALDFAGGVAAARSNELTAQNPRARAWFALLLARDDQGGWARAVADSLLAADSSAPWGWFARAAAVGYGFPASPDSALAASAEMYRRAPRHPDVVWVRGAMLANAARPAEAIAVADSFLARNPRSLAHVVLRANATWGAGGASRKDSALALWAEARSLDSTDVLAWSAAGSRLLNDGRATEALPLLRRAAELAPTSVRVRRDYWRALRTVGTQDPEVVKAEALPGIERLVAARGSDPAALQALASEYAAFSMPDAQRALEDRVLRDYPRSISADWILIDRYRAAGDAMRDTSAHDPARKTTFVRLLKEFIARPMHADDALLGDAYLELFLVTDSTAHPDSLLAIVRGMAQYERLNPHLSFARGAIALADRGTHLDEAERIAREGQRAGRRRIDGNRRFYETIGDYARALDSMNSIMIDALGWVFYRAGRLSEAEQELRRAYELNPQYLTVLFHLGQLSEAAGRADTAESYYIRGAMIAAPGVNPNRAALRALFVARRGSAAGYDEYYAGIRDLDRTRRRAAIGAERKAPGDRASMPPFRLASLAGDTVPSSALTGHVVVINFWGKWCGPCVAEMPELQRFSRLVAPDTAVLFVTINNDEDVRDLREWVRRQGYDLPILLDGGYRTRAGVNVYPTTWFVDRAGRIAFIKAGWSEELAEEFGWRVELLKAEPSAP